MTSAVHPGPHHPASLPPPPLTGQWCPPSPPRSRSPEHVFGTAMNRRLTPDRGRCTDSPPHCSTHRTMLAQTPIRTPPPLLTTPPRRRYNSSAPQAPPHWKPYHHRVTFALHFAGTRQKTRWTLPLSDSGWTYESNPEISTPSPATVTAGTTPWQCSPTPTTPIPRTRRNARRSVQPS